ncbi:uncharacterized protein TNCV_3581111 [Trichonephila clavipes]|nr:uncharacterized protein TNCV_3581111 [Trichonephila clavipes]
MNIHGTFCGPKWLSFIWKDGAPPLITRFVKQVLHHHFGDDRILNLHFSTAWPPRFPNLNPSGWRVKKFVQEALAVFEELPTDDDSAASNNSDTDDEDYVENVAQGKNISSDDEEIDDIQGPSTSYPEV